jgi:hypothetical protein
MGANDCPCKGCVAPKRHSGCHSVCEEYIAWHLARQDELALIHRIHQEETDCFPNKYRNGKSIKKRMRR